MLQLSLLLMAIATCATSSPFALTDKYVAEFKAGLAELTKSTHDYEFHEESYDPSLHNETEAKIHALEYDFVIIGAGASGSVIANRLSEIPEWKILLLEAGSPETDYTLVPRLSSMFQKSDFNWGHVTTVQKNWCKGMIDNKCALASGKALGGSTAINGMIFTRGNPKDYDLWADLGNDGWCYDDVLPYFKKLEDAHIKNPDSKYHNHGGPLHVENPQHLTDLADVALDAGLEEHLPTVDYNGKDQIGMGLIQTNTKHGKRHSTAQAYLEPAKKRKNLTILPRSHVIEIIISPHTKQATGVKYLHDGRELRVAMATKEVVLSAGALNTPQILKLSGIGPKLELEGLDINVVKDLDVGGSLKDHIAFLGLDYVYNDTTQSQSEEDQIVDYLKNGKGRLTTTGCDVLGFVQTEVSKETKYPDIELFFFKSESNDNLGLNVHRYKPEIYDKLWKPNPGQKSIKIGVLLAHPRSQGTIKLKDKDPLHLPLIDPNQLTDSNDHDLNTLVAGIKKAIKLTETKPFQKLGVEINDHVIAGCEEYKFGTDDYWKCAIKHMAVSLRYYTGTAKMGPHTDEHAVVDNKLNVYGVEKLRIADTSVIPVTITGHTMAPAIMIGEKAADLIKDTWK